MEARVCCVPTSGESRPSSPEDALHHAPAWETLRCRLLDPAEERLMYSR